MSDQTGDAEATNSPRADGPASRRRLVFAWIMLGAGAVILLATAWVGWRTYQAYRNLQAAAAQVSALQQQLSGPTRVGSSDSRQAIIAGLQADAASARSAVDDPVYGLATGIPFVGPNLDAIRQVGLTVDTLSTEVIPSLDSIARTLDPSALAPKDGAIDLAPIVAVAPQLQLADSTVQAARTRLQQIDRSAVVAPVGDAVASLQAKLDSAADLTAPAARTARLLPAALGAAGPRTYLVVFQNLAEPRATGGIFGSYAVVTADHGKVSIVNQSPARSLKVFEPPVSDLSAEQQQLFGPELVTYPADVNLTPDFPTAAQLFVDMYQARGGGAVDGVLAVDPVALSYLLKGTPPLEVDGVSIDAENVVATLLSTAYAKYDDASQEPRDQFLATATAAAFGQVMSGSANPESVVAGLRKAAVERRLLYYSTHSDEEADLAPTGLSGALDGSTEESSIGAFVNDAVGSKLGYYLTGKATVVGGQCQADGSQLATVAITLGYQPPAELPPYVVGRGVEGAYRIHLLLAAPSAARINAAEVNGQPVSLRTGTDRDRPVGAAVVDLEASADSTVTFYLSVPPGSPVPAFVHTPTVGAWPATVEGFGSCGQ